MTHLHDRGTCETCDASRRYVWRHQLAHYLDGFDIAAYALIVAIVVGLMFANWLLG